MPATVGWRRPALLLPADWREWGETDAPGRACDELRMSGAAITRRASGPSAASPATSTNPCDWLAARLRLQQELAADAWRARFAGGNEPYLQTLARLALRRDDRPAAWPARAFFPIRGTLIRRIEMLRDAKTTADLNPKRRILVLTLAPSPPPGCSWRACAAAGSSAGPGPGEAEAGTGRQARGGRRSIRPEPGSCRRLHGRGRPPGEPGGTARFPKVGRTARPREPARPATRHRSREGSRKSRSSCSARRMPHGPRARRRRLHSRWSSAPLPPRTRSRWPGPWSHGL